jgi:inhibitor of cysteine peptidase
MKKRILILLFLIVMIIAVGCNKPVTNDIEISLAPIHEVDVLFMESFPIQVGVNIKLGLSSGCTTFHDAVVTRNGNTINIEVTTQRPKDKMCTAIYGYFDKNLNIGSDFTAGTTYTLKVNDYTTTFKMP